MTGCARRRRGRAAGRRAGGASSGSRTRRSPSFIRPTAGIRPAVRHRTRLAHQRLAPRSRSARACCSSDTSSPKRRRYSSALVDRVDPLQPGLQVGDAPVERGQLQPRRAGPRRSAGRARRRGAAARRPARRPARRRPGRRRPRGPARSRPAPPVADAAPAGVGDRRRGPPRAPGGRRPSASIASNIGPASAGSCRASFSASRSTRERGSLASAPRLAGRRGRRRDGALRRRRRPTRGSPPRAPCRGRRRACGRTPGAAPGP